jgi:hypothetical protein
MFGLLSPELKNQQLKERGLDGGGYTSWGTPRLGKETGNDGRAN